MSVGCMLVSAGPTREYLDDVRYITNASSGRMGIWVAEAAARRGWDVHLALGPTPLEPPAGVHVHPFTSAQELAEVARRLWAEVDAFVATAAVGDYRPSTRFVGKRKKGDGPWQLEMVRNPDILWERSREKGHRCLVGFALESDPRPEEAMRKLVNKGLDLILLNSTANLGSTEGNFDWIEATGTQEPLGAIDKRALAERIVTFVTDHVTRGRAKASTGGGSADAPEAGGHDRP